MPKYVFGGDDVEVRVGTFPQLVSAGVAISVFMDSAGTVPATDMKAIDNTSVTTLRVTGASQIPLFYLNADTHDTVYVSINNGPVTAIYARSDDRLDALAVRVTTVEGAIASEPVGVVIPLVDPATFDYNQVSGLGQALNFSAAGSPPFIVVGDGVGTWNDASEGYGLVNEAEIGDTLNDVTTLKSLSFGVFDYGPDPWTYTIPLNGNVLFRVASVGDGASVTLPNANPVLAQILVVDATNMDAIDWLGLPIYSTYDGSPGSVLCTVTSFGVVIVPVASGGPDPGTAPSFTTLFQRSDVSAVAAQPTDYGKIMRLTAGPPITVNGHKHLFIGYGDYDTNTGPLDLVSWDLNTSAVHTWKTAWHTEQYTHARVLNNGDVWFASMDPRGSEDATLVQIAASNGTVSTHTVSHPASPSGLTVMEHCFDVTQTSDGTLFVCGSRQMIPTDRHYIASVPAGGAGTMAIVWKSVDGGTTWTEDLAVTVADDGMSTEDGFTRFYGFMKLGDYLFLNHPSGIFQYIWRNPTSGVWTTYSPDPATYGVGAPNVVHYPAGWDDVAHWGPDQSSFVQTTESEEDGDFGVAYSTALGTPMYWFLFGEGDEGGVVPGRLFVQGRGLPEGWQNLTEFGGETTLLRFNWETGVVAVIGSTGVLNHWDSFPNNGSAAYDPATQTLYLCDGNLVLSKTFLI